MEEEVPTPILPSGTKLVFYGVSFCPVYPNPLIKEVKTDIIWGGGDEPLYIIPRYVNVGIIEVNSQSFNIWIIEHGSDIIGQIVRYFKVISTTNTTKTQLADLLLSNVDEKIIWKSREEKDFPFYGLLAQYLLLSFYNEFELIVTKENEIKVNGKTFKIVSNY